MLKTSPWLIVPALLLVAACSPAETDGPDGDAAAVMTDEEQAAFDMYREFKAGFDDEILDGSLKKVGERKFEGLLTIREKDGEVETLRCEVNLRESDGGMGGASCYLPE